MGQDPLRRLERLETAVGVRAPRELDAGTRALLNRIAKRAAEGPIPTDEQRLAMGRANAIALQAARAGDRFDASIYLDHEARVGIGRGGRHIAPQGLTLIERRTVIGEMVRRAAEVVP
jgi:hypothetical protein